jgi:hypothetical protein
MDTAASGGEISRVNLIGVISSQTAEAAKSKVSGISTGTAGTSGSRTVSDRALYEFRVRPRSNIYACSERSAWYASVSAGAKISSAIAAVAAGAGLNGAVFNDAVPYARRAPANTDTGASSGPAITAVAATRRVVIAIVAAGGISSKAIGIADNTVGNDMIAADAEGAGGEDTAAIKTPQTRAVRGGRSGDYAPAGVCERQSI